MAIHHSATGNLTPKTDEKWWPLLPLLKRHSWSKRKWPFKRTRFYRWQNLTFYSCWIRDFVEKSSGGGFSAYLSHRRRFSNQNAIIADCRAGNFRFILIYNLFRKITVTKQLITDPRAETFLSQNRISLLLRRFSSQPANHSLIQSSTLYYSIIVERANKMEMLFVFGRWRSGPFISSD